MSGKQQKKRKAGRNNRRIAIINLLTFLVVAIALLWVLKIYLHIGDSNFTNDAQIETFINPINSRIPAYIDEIHYIEHQKVKKGDTLIVLDKREVQTQLAQAEAAYMSALASKRVSASTINTVTNNLTVMESNIAGAKARLWSAEQDYKRYKSLLADEAVTKQQYEQKQTEYKSMKAQYTSSLHQYNTSRLAIKEAVSKVALNEAEIKRARAALEMARLNLSYTVITAPHDGVMGRRLVNEGQLMQAGQQVAMIVSDRKKWIVANYRERQMSGVHVGGKVTICVDALGDLEFEGIITAISEATGAKFSAIPVDNSTGNFVKVQQRIPVHIEFTSGNSEENMDKLRAGMNVEIRLK